MTTLKKPSKRKIINNFYLNDTFADILQSSPIYRIEEEEGTFIKYRKTRIIFDSFNSPIPWSWTTPEVDTINCIDLQSSKKELFTSLREAGYSTPLINYFSDCEKTGSFLKDPEYNDILLKRYKGKASVNSEIKDFYHYHLEGGNLVFHRILEKDPNFWSTIVRACRETNLVKISELHLALDCSNDLMPFVSTGIQKGHYESSGLRLHAYYTLAGIKNNKSVGKRSENFKKIQGKEFRIHTLYFGDSKFEPISIAIYDKALERRERQEAVSQCQTRIELRFNVFNKSVIPVEYIYRILDSYSSQEGSTYRTSIFLYYLTSKLRFSNHFHDHGVRDLAPWWKYQVLSPLYHATLNKPEEVSSSSLLNSSSLPLLAGSLPAKRPRGRPKGCKDKIKRKPKVYDVITHEVKDNV